MSSIYSFPDYVAEPLLATIELGRLLRMSALRLFIGAGASSGFGLPEWSLLIARVLQKDNDPTFMAGLESRTSTELLRLLNDIDDGSEDYVRRVHESLYRDVAANLLEQLQRSPLLLAVAALTTGAHRGRVDSVVTYNYDDLLEQYLRMLGLTVCRRTKPDSLSTKADVELNYVHGRLPQEWGTPISIPEIILSDKSYRSRRAEIDTGWSAMVVNGLYSKIGLFLALSGDDGSVLDILKRAQTRIQRGGDYTGYWLLTPEAFERNKDDVLEVGMCPIRLQKEQIAQFVFSICQRAATT